MSGDSILAPPPVRYTSVNTGTQRAYRTDSHGHRPQSLADLAEWDRTLLDGRNGAATWCGHGVFSHNLVKISALAG
jgi:hypothetical protein